MSSSRILFLVALLTACGAVFAASLPKITEERNAAVGFALTTDLVTNSLSGNCATLGGDIKALAGTSRQQWKERNLALVAAANSYLLYVRARIANQQGEKAGVSFYESQKDEFISNAKAALDDTFPSGEPDEKICTRMLSAVAAGSFDFASHADHLKELISIRADMAQMEGK